MKTSNKLLILLLGLTIFALVGSGFSLESQFEKIDKNDPYWSYQKEQLPTFHHIRLEGNSHSFVKIESGEQPVIRKAGLTDENGFWPKTKIVGDTLVLSFKSRSRPYPYTGRFDHSPIVSIAVNDLQSISSSGITCLIQGLKQDSLQIVQRDYGVKLSNSKIKNLRIQSATKARIYIGQANELDQTSITLTDSGLLDIEKNVFKSLHLEADSSTHVSIPAGLLKKL